MKFLVKMTKQDDEIYFIVPYLHDHYNNYINQTIAADPKTKAYKEKGYEYPTVVASFDGLISQELQKIENLLPDAEKNRKGFPAQYWDLVNKKKELIQAAEIRLSDKFVVV